MSTSTTKVLHVINGEHYSGAERVQDLLGQRLPEFGFHADFACVKPGRFPAQYQSPQSQIHTVSMRSRFDVAAARRLAAIVREGAYEILHAHTPRTLMLASLAAKRADVPLVYHVHSPTRADSTRRLQNWINARVETFGLRRADRLITVSASLANLMRSQGFGDGQVFVVHNGVPATERRRNGNPPEGRWTLGTVALFRPRKGTEVLLDALANLRMQGHDVHLRAVGPFETDTYEAQLRGQAERLRIADAVEWTGFTSDVNAELCRMDLFVLPSLFGEGLPMVVLEAMAAGVPAVGTEVEGVPEAIVDGECGILAKPGDATDMSQALERVLAGVVDWSELRERALTRHAERFSDVSMACGVADVYRGLLR
ncbi:MAG: glycosyltransferase [Planctomycetales bacterium]|nr:glycosyltransferase [Planctomycetales bacterium]